jgi:hypothetical protein
MTGVVDIINIIILIIDQIHILRLKKLVFNYLRAFNLILLI